MSVASLQVWVETMDGLLKRSGLVWGKMTCIVVFSRFNVCENNIGLSLVIKFSS